MYSQVIQGSSFTVTNKYLRNWALLWEVPLLRRDPAPRKMLEEGKIWPCQWQGLFSFQALSQDKVYHSTEHLVSMSAWNNPSCTGTLSKIISICMWHSLNYHTQTFLVWTAFRHSATSFCRPDLSAPHSESHVGHCNHLSEKKKISRVQTGTNSTLMWLCPVHCMLHWVLAQTHCTCHRYFVNTISNII